VFKAVFDAPSNSQTSLQLLQIAIRYVTAAPIGHSIKLNTVGELHLFGAEDALELPLPLLIPPMLAVVVLISVALVGFPSKVLEFYHILVRVAHPVTCV